MRASTLTNSKEHLHLRNAKTKASYVPLQWFLKLFERTEKKNSRSYKAKFQIYTNESLNWLQIVLRLQGTVIPAILPSIILCGAYGFLVSLAYDMKLPLSFPQVSKVLPNVVVTFNIILSLLLVFRTNTAHERFWEGRKLWGSLVNTVRNLSRDILIFIDEQEPSDRLKKESILRLTVAFSVAMKLHLRRDPINEELKPLMSALRYSKLKAVNHAPLEIAFWIGDYLQHQYKCNSVNIYQLTALQKLVDDLVDILGGCERILKTPLPLAYAIKLKQLLLIYCLILPFELVGGLGFWTGPILALVSFILLGIEEIGAEIEEPFGHDPNDLPLDFICNTMLKNIEDLINSAPGTPLEKLRLKQ
ncbi:bestrophin family ion channel [Microcoleus sp. herbarium19]|uniref:bestrophin family protein n=1 Tax=unclassified Microcoleus TaxID=2642155 RepID=UPI002FD22635